MADTILCFREMAPNSSVVVMTAARRFHPASYRGADPLGWLSATEAYKTDCPPQMITAALRFREALIANKALPGIPTMEFRAVHLTRATQGHGARLCLWSVTPDLLIPRILQGPAEEAVLYIAYKHVGALLPRTERDARRIQALLLSPRGPFLRCEARFS